MPKDKTTVYLSKRDSEAIYESLWVLNWVWQNGSTVEAFLKLWPSVHGEVGAELSQAIAAKLSHAQTLIHLFGTAPTLRDFYGRLKYDAVKEKEEG